MLRVSLLGSIFILLLLLGGAVYAVFFGVPAPKSEVHKTIPVDHFKHK